MTDFQMTHPGSPRFRFRCEKAAEAIEFIAREQPGITQYFIGKFLYLADKAHFLDWGRPITFDRYVAMKHGPVPSAVRNMLAAAAGLDAGMDEERLLNAQADARALHERVRIELDVSAKGGELQRVFPLDASSPFRYLSGSDVEALRLVFSDNRGKSFGWMRTQTHKDDAWWALRQVRPHDHMASGPGRVGRKAKHHARDHARCPEPERTQACAR